MNDSERLEATQIFVAAIRNDQARPSPVPFEPRVFADVVATLREKGNPFALRFMVLNSVEGKTCPDFKSGMTLAQTAGLITRENPTYTWFSVRMPPRVAKQTLADFTERQAVEELARAYCTQVGLPRE